MKTVEKILGVSAQDITTVVPAIKSGYERITRDYHERTHPKLKMLDSLIILSLLSYVVQFVYARLVGQDPYNSYLAGLFCSLGQFALCGKIIYEVNIWFSLS